MDCSKCDCYIATINNDDELRKKTAKLWSELNGVEIPYQAMNCTGCRSEGIKSGYCEHICLVRKCAKENKFETCAICSKKDSCAKLKPYFESHPEAKENLK